MKNLRKELHNIKTGSKSEATTDENDQIKTSLKAFIKACQYDVMGINTHRILEVLESLHTKDPNVLSIDEYQWCKKELENNKPYPTSPSKETVQPSASNEINFCKEVVQNSIVSCRLLVSKQEDMDIKDFVHEISLFEGNKSIGLPLDTEAQHEGAVHRYLIASAKDTTNSDDHVVYYIAFGNNLCLREWSDNYNSFKEGIHACRFNIIPLIKLITTCSF